jgi:hypothetical protein
MQDAGPGPKRLWWKLGLVVVLAFAAAAAFAAYLRPDMLVTFNDLMAFCASLIR